MFLEAKTVPLSLRIKVEQELEKLQNDGIIEPISHSLWATPIVSVIKKNDNVRLCGDYKLTANPVMCVNQYPLPKIDDIFATLAGGKKYSKLDLTQRYHHMDLDEATQTLLVINKNKELLQVQTPSIWYCILPNLITASDRAGIAEYSVNTNDQ